MTRSKTLLSLFTALALLTAIALAIARVRADDDDDEGDRRMSFKQIAPATNVKFKAECSGCHMLYLPGLLPARSWKKMMEGLNDHFGESASLDEKARLVIAEFLADNAADRAPSRRSLKIAESIPVGETPLRISETFYFKRKHREVKPEVFKRKKIGSAANCVACHPGAERGDFEEDRVAIPR